MMEVRAFCLALGILAALVWPGRLSLARPRPRWGIEMLMLFVAATAVLWVGWRVAGWSGFWWRNPFQVLPVDSVLIGYVVGHILAAGRAPVESGERIPAATDARGEAPAADTAGPAPAPGLQRPAAAQSKIKEATDRALDWATSLMAAVRGTVTGVAVVALLALGVVPPQIWGQFVHRLEGVKAAGVEFTLGTVVGDRTAQAIITAAPPPGLLSDSIENDRHGFVPPRLERMINLTYPVQLPDGGRRPGEVLREDPSFLLFASIRDAPWSREDQARWSQPFVRAVLRDRAMLLHLHLAEAAVDTTRQSRSIHGAGRPRIRREDGSGILPQLVNLGGTQEIILAQLGRHVACVREVIEATNDRRLTEYRTARVVEELFMVAHLWSSLEKLNVMAQLGVERASGDGARIAAFRELLVRASLLTYRMREFTWWADNTIEALRVGRHRERGPGDGNTTQPPPAPQVPLEGAASASLIATRVLHTAGAGTEPQSAEGRSDLSTWPRPPDPPDRGLNKPKDEPFSRHCDFRPERVATIEAVINPGPAEPNGTRKTALDDDKILEQQEKLFSKQGFTPYLVTFVAQALSAMGDHSGALRMLMSWQRDLNELAGLAGAREHAPGLGEATTVALDRRPSTVRRDEARRFLLAAPWYRLATFVDILILQELSENTDFAVTPTEAGLRYVVMQLFPEVLSQASRGTMLREWQVEGAEACRQPAHSWMQSVVIAYATWVKSYLDKRNKNLVQPEDVTEQDLAFADLLAQLDLECFPTSLRGEEAVAEQRLHFAVTSVAVKLNRVVDGRFDAESRDKVRIELEDLIRSAIHGFESSRGQGTRAPSERQEDRLERLVFGRGDHLVLRAAKSIKKRLDNLNAH